MTIHTATNSSKHSDLIVVGGGSAGCAVAAGLVKAGYSVTLVEAGPDYGAFEENRWPAELVDARMLPFNHDWGYEAGRWTFGRAKVIGGCSSHNGCIAAVGHRVDYDSWQLPGWSGNEVDPIFKRVVEAMRVRTYQPSEAGPFHARCLKAAEALGWRMGNDLCDLDENDGFGLETVNIFGTTRWNSAFAYLDPIRHLSNLTIVDHALVDRFEEGTQGATLSILRHGEAMTLSGDHLVVAAGVYGTPEILQRSGVGDPSLLQSLDIPVAVPLPKVGANLHDHPMIQADRRVGPELQRWLDEATRDGFVPEEQTLGKAISSVAEDGLYDLHIFPACGSDQTSYLHGRVHIEVACVTPQSRGALQITSKNPEVKPAIDHNYLGDEAGHDLAVLKDGVALANDLLNHPELSTILGESITDTRTEAGIRAHVAHYYHPVGTCAMGLADDDVCDANGRVRGLKHTTIADVSLMPQIPRANTNLPAVMIGERIAEILTNK
ncbi:MAG: FAD-dependent oxidoreductase [Chloroflexota bacterium]